MGEGAAQESWKGKEMQKTPPLYSGRTILCHIYIICTYTSLFSFFFKLNLKRINIQTVIHSLNRKITEYLPSAGHFTILSFRKMCVHVCKYKFTQQIPIWPHGRFVRLSTLRNQRDGAQTSGYTHFGSMPEVVIILLAP